MVVSEILAAIPVDADQAIDYLRSQSKEQLDLVRKHAQQLKDEGEIFEDLTSLERAGQIIRWLDVVRSPSHLQQPRKWTLPTKSGEITVVSTLTDSEARDVVLDRLKRGEAGYGDFAQKLIVLHNLSLIQQGWLHYFATKTAPKGIFIGQVGRRIKVEVKITRVIPREGRFGTQYVVGMEELKTGNELVWFASSAPHVQVGEVVNYEVLVKEHSVYNDRKQTVVNRCKIIPGI